MEDGLEFSNRSGSTLSQVFRRTQTTSTTTENTPEYEGGPLGVYSHTDNDVNAYVGLHPRSDTTYVPPRKPSVLRRWVTGIVYLLSLPFYKLNELLHLRELKSELHFAKKDMRFRTRLRFGLMYMAVAAVIYLVFYYHYKTSSLLMWKQYGIDFNGFAGTFYSSSGKKNIDFSEFVDKSVVILSNTDKETYPPKPPQLSVSPRFFYPTLFYEDHADGSELPLYETEAEFEQQAASCEEVTAMELQLGRLTYYSNATHTVTESVSELFSNMEEFVKRHNHTVRWWSFGCATMFLPREPGWRHPCLCTVDMGGGLLENMANLALLLPTDDMDIKKYKISESVGYIAELRDKKRWITESVPLKYSYMSQDGRQGHGGSYNPEINHRLRDVVRVMRGTFKEWSEETSFSLPLQKRNFIKVSIV